MKRVRVLKVKNDKSIKEAKNKSWHKGLLKNVIYEIQELCPILDLNNENLYISISINNYKNITNIIFGFKSFDNEIFKVSDIVHNKKKIIQMGSNYGLITY